MLLIGRIGDGKRDYRGVSACYLGRYRNAIVTTSLIRQRIHILTGHSIIQMSARTISLEETEVAQELLGNARPAMDAIADYDQPNVDRICQAIAWATATMPTAVRLANMSVDESGLGSL